MQYGRAASLPVRNQSMPTLMEQLRLKILAKHFSRRTGKAYEAWNRRYISFHGGRHPRDMGHRKSNSCWVG